MGISFQCTRVGQDVSDPVVILAKYIQCRVWFVDRAAVDAMLT